MRAPAEARSFQTVRRIRPTPIAVLVVVVVGLLLVFVAGLRHGDSIPDLSTYEQWYHESVRLNEYLATPALLFIKDPGYFLLTAAFAQFQVPFAVFLFVFALVCVTLKLKGILTLSNAPVYSLIIYISFYFFADEMIAIRAGAASAIFLLSIPALVERRYLAYTGWVLLATCFHYSAIVLLPLVLLSDERARPTLYLLLLIASVVGATFGLTLDSLIARLPGFGIDPRIAVYLLGSETESVANHIFNRVSLPNLMLCVILLANFRRLQGATPYASHIIRIFTISQIAFFAFSGVAVFGVRLSQLIGITGIVAWPLLLCLLRPRWLAAPIVVAVGLVFFSSSLRFLALPPWETPIVISLSPGAARGPLSRPPHSGESLSFGDRWYNCPGVIPLAPDRCAAA